MAGVNVSASGGGRRSLDAEINAVPMVDLMMVTISFLLITAVWSHMARLDATTAVPSSDPAPPVENDARPKTLEIEAKADRFVVSWKRGAQTLETSDVAVEDAKHAAGAVRYPALAAKIAEAWRSGGEHRDASDHAFDRAVLKVHDRMPYGDIVGVMDAVEATHRPVVRAGKMADAPAFELVMGK